LNLPSEDEERRLQKGISFKLKEKEKYLETILRREERVVMRSPLEGEEEMILRSWFSIGQSLPSSIRLVKNVNLMSKKEFLTIKFRAFFLQFYRSQKSPCLAFSKASK